MHGYDEFEKSCKNYWSDSDNKVSLLLDYTDRKGASIADPWNSGNFVKTYEDIVEGCQGFLKYLGYEI